MTPEQIRQAIRAGLLPREVGEKLLAQLPSSSPPPPVREEKKTKIVEASRKASTATPPPPAAPEPPQPQAQEQGPVPNPPATSPQVVVIRDASANWRIVAAILAAIGAAIKILHACM